ncbi:MAG: hypothetical protein GXP58_09030 [Deltaproteobacteria bacterium]|nr:hypothetical protein [Deltaproteobacteria bacterium]
MTESYSDEQVREYLKKVEADIAGGRIDSETFRNDFSLHQAEVRKFDFDIDAEEVRVDFLCRDWLKANSGTVNPFLPHRIVFRDVVQIYYRNRVERDRLRIFDLAPLSVSERLLEAKDLYQYRVDSGKKPIALEVDMPLEDTELAILCSEFDVYVGDSVVTVIPGFPA